MKELILDVNIEVKPTSEGYPKYFFDDLSKPNRIKLVIGGTKYKSELRKKPSLVSLIGELTSIGKIRSVPDAAVDLHEDKLETKIKVLVGNRPTECDDQHILALAHKSGCLNVLTNDIRMATCKTKIRKYLGHDLCPDIKVISTQKAYDDI